MPLDECLEIDLAYAAGILDGEGYVGIKCVPWTRYRTDRKTPGYHARVTVRMVQPESVAMLCALMDVPIARAKGYTARARPLVQFAVTDLKAERLLRALLPYLRLKRENAANVIALRDWQAQERQHRTKITGWRDFTNPHGTVRRIPNLCLSDEYIAECHRLYEFGKALNARGID